MVYRGVRGGVEDRWFKSVKQSDGSTVEAPSAKHGTKLRWRARYVDAEGNEREKNFEVKREAEVWLRARQSEVDAGTHVDRHRGKLTVAEMHSEWTSAQGHIARKTKNTRAAAWRVHVEPRWGRVPLASVRKTEIGKWVAKMKDDGIGVATIENAYHVLSMTLGTAVDEKRIATNPADGVKLPKRGNTDRHYLSDEQVVALSLSCARDGLVVLFLAYTGLRWGEMAALRVRDLDMKRRRIQVSRSVTESEGLDWSNPKDQEPRSVPFPKSLCTPLNELMRGKKGTDLVFTDTRGNVLRVSNWRSRVFADAVVVCHEGDDGFPTDLTPRDLRHTAASLAVSAGANVLAVQRMLGHAKPSITLNTYSDLFDSDLDLVATALDEKLRAAAGFLRDDDSGDTSTANEETPD
ncbi:tyrosine-type recombinase/integrase [Mycobacteroides abscessus]|uniref:tyrosine-type recombinase/integrase n=1 Tax=Mycobacteroides abscessus TaxID=36809 RepID=UPI0019D0046B|nr:site-specific integrase [Mycobacteroides abscessus]MBN7385442.1 site-specific integrase [Mycobacteroides abscessus subsp. abscessus]MBN7414347.1 site-specific integrase [Mycobacteroides abscessus subsp. abscessus]